MNTSSLAAPAGPTASNDEPRRSGRVRRNAYLLGLAFSLIYPSTAIFKKVGYPALIVYVIGAGVLCWWGMTKFIPWLLARRAPSGAYAVAAVAMIVGVLSLYLIVHPRIDTAGFRIGRVVVGASDNDDAIDVALGEMRAGRYPYYAKTFLNLPLSPLPGMLLLALPFYLFGDSAVQTVFWTAAFFWFFGWHLRSIRKAVVLAGMVLLLSPNVSYQIAQGIDFGANSIYLLVFAALLLERVRRRGSASIGAIVWAVLLGIGLASRMNFVLIVPFVFVALWHASSWRTAVLLMGITLIVSAGITIPFYLYDPSGFSPLHVFSKISGRGILSWGRYVVPAAACLLSAGLLWRRRAAYDVAELARDLCVVMAFLSLAVLAFAAMRTGRIELEPAHFGMMCLFLGVFGCGSELLKQATTEGFR